MLNVASKRLERKFKHPKIAILVAILFPRPREATLSSASCMLTSTAGLLLVCCVASLSQELHLMELFLGVEMFPCLGN